VTAESDFRSAEYQVKIKLKGVKDMKNYMDFTAGLLGKAAHCLSITVVAAILMLIASGCRTAAPESAPAVVPASDRKHVRQPVEDPGRAERRAYYMKNLDVWRCKMMAAGDINRQIDAARRIIRLAGEALNHSELWSFN
jgi:hypothetical protein